MKLLIRILTIFLSLTLLAGVGVAAFLVWTNTPTDAAPSGPPTVEFRSVELGEAVTVSVQVTGDRVTRAELWAENQLLARETNPNPALSDTWMVAWQWTPPAPGVYSLAARAFDSAGRYGASTLFNVVVPPRQRLIFSSNRAGQLVPGQDQPLYSLYTITPSTRATELSSQPSSQDRQPNVSRTGVVAFASQRAGAWHILTRAPNSTQSTDLTPDLVSAQRPVWSPDGQHLAFELTSANATNLIISDARGQNRAQVTQGNAYDGQASFSPDGSRLVFAGQRGGQWDIYMVDANGQNLTRLTSDSAQDWQPAWSPDGGRIAFASNRSGVSEIYVMSATENGEPVQLTNFPSGAEQPAWSADGNWLAFVGYTGDAQGSNRREIYLMYAPKGQAPVAERGLIRLTQNLFDDTEPAWLP
jgi:Tol biopolymer transport system component